MTSLFRPATGPTSTGPTSPEARRARWIAVLPLAATEQHGPHLPLGTDVMIARGLSGAGARAVARQRPGDVPAAAAGRHFHRAYRLSRHADAADRRRAEGAGWRSARSVARAGVKKLVMVTSHGGNSAAMTLVAQDLRAQHRASCGHHELVALRRAGGIVLRGRIASRHPWRRGRDLDHAGAISAQRAQGGDRRFSSREHRDGKGLSLALDASAGAVRLAGAGSAPERRGRRCDARPPPRRANNCSITARARSANCSPRSITST